MKKVLLALLLLLLPLSIVEAYPNEPSGFASLYWGESLSSVKSRYTTDFLEYKGKDGASYMVTIPEVRGELGIKGKVFAMCLFHKNRLWEIKLIFPREDAGFAKKLQDERRYLISICGNPTYINGLYYWTGDTTTMWFTQKEDGYSIDLVDAKFLKQLLHQAEMQNRYK